MDNHDVCPSGAVSRSSGGGSCPDIATVAAREAVEIARRERAYRGDREPQSLGGKTVILIDDGLVTGATMRAAAQAIRVRGPAKVVIAVPVAALSTCDALRTEVDAIVCAETPEPFHAFGLWYQDFSQITDDEVRTLLSHASREALGVRMRLAD